MGRCLGSNIYRCSWHQIVEKRMLLPECILRIKHYLTTITVTIASIWHESLFKDEPNFYGDHTVVLHNVLCFKI